MSAGSERPSHEHLNRPLTPAAMALALTIFALWGANNLAIKVAVEAIPPLAAAGLRFGLAIGILALWGRSRGVGIRLQPGELKLLAGLSALFLIQIGALNVAQKLTSAVRGTVFLASHPLFIGLFASLLIPGDKLTRQRLVGLLLAFAGVFVTFAEGFFQPGAYLWGDALMMVSAVLLGLRLIVLKLILQRTPVARTLFWQATLSVPVFFGLSLLFERHAWGHVAARHVGAMLYQGVVIAGFCFAGNAWLYENFRASQIAAFTFSVPLWGVLICGLVAHDPITVWLVAGVALVATGIAVANRSSGAEPADEEEPPVLEPAEP